MPAASRIFAATVGGAALAAVAITGPLPGGTVAAPADTSSPEVRTVLDPHLRIQTQNSLRIRGWKTATVTLQPGATLRRTVKVTPAKQVRTVRLQKWQAGDRWRTITSAKPNRKGRTSMRWLVSGSGAIQLRILAKAKRGWASTATSPQPATIVTPRNPAPTPSPEPSPNPTPSPDPDQPPAGPGFEMPATIPDYPTAAVGQASQYAWMDATARWHPCTQAITWHQDLGTRLTQYGGTQAGERALTAGALNTIGNLSGYTFVQVFDPAQADVLIDGTDELPGSQIGVGGFSSLGDTAVAGSVTIDVPQMASLPANMRQAVYAHELGHVLGLGHTDGTRQTMYPSLGGDNAAFGLGDQAGFAAMPGGASCG